MRRADVISLCRESRRGSRGREEDDEEEIEGEGKGELWKIHDDKDKGKSGWRKRKG